MPKAPTRNPHRDTVVAKKVKRSVFPAPTPDGPELPELTPQAMRQLSTNTSIRGLLRALYDGIPALAIELEHAWAPFPAWLSDLAQFAAAADQPAQASQPYAVMQCQFRMRYDDKQPLDLRAVAMELLTGLRAGNVHEQLKSYLATETDRLADAFAAALTGKFAHVVPVQFATATTMPTVVMAHRVAFGFDGNTGELIVEWIGTPNFVIPSPPAQ